MVDTPSKRPDLAPTLLSEGTSGAPHARARHAPGEVIAGKYRLLRQLDEGGMGAVWVAHNLALDIQVALKVLHPNLESADADERLVREARAAARLDHPAIVRVLDVGRTADEEPFLVMELLDGEPLCDVLARERRLDPTAAVRTLLPIAGALAAMHGKGMIHRDVKPENIFLARGDDTGRWQPKLIDFGLAKHGGPLAHRLTQRGAVLGTPGYMSPEQMDGVELDARTDVWSLCTVIYEVITGALPFHGETALAKIAAALTAPPRPLAEHGVHDDELGSILRRGLAPRDERWPSVRELGRALAGWLWRRGVTRDVTGVSLQPAWLDDADLQRLAAPPASSRVATARFPAPPDRPDRAGRRSEIPPPPSEETASLALPSLRRTDVGFPLRAPLTTTAPVPLPRRPPPARSRPALVMALLAAALLVLAGVISLWRLAQPPLPVAADAGPPVVASPAMTAAPSLAATPTASGSPAPTADPSATADPRALARPPVPARAPAPRSTATALPKGLKDPYR